MIGFETVAVVIAMILIHEGFSIMGRKTTFSWKTYKGDTKNWLSMGLSFLSSIILLYMGEGVMDVLSMSNSDVYAVFVGYSGQSVFKSLMKGYEGRAIRKGAEAP